MRATGRLALVLLTAALLHVPSASAQSGKVERTTRTANDTVDPLGAVATAWLVGLSQEPPETLRPANLAPSWLEQLRTEFAALWGRDRGDRDTLHAFADHRPTVLRLDGRAARGAQVRPWSALGCAPAAQATVEHRVLATRKDGVSLVGLSLVCRGEGDAEALRLVARVRALGEIEAVFGLATPLPAKFRGARWPLGPARLDAPGRPLTRSGGVWLGALDHDDTPEDDDQTLTALPGPVAHDDDANMLVAQPPRWLAFDDDGAPLASLIDGPLAALPSEAAAAKQRAPFEQLAPASTMAVAALPRVGVWTIDKTPTSALAVLLVGRIGKDLAIHDATVAVFDLAPRTVQRVAVALPRTSTVGRWRCDEEDRGAAMRCRFEAEALPGGAGFEPRRLVRGRDGFAVRDGK